MVSSGYVFDTRGSCVLSSASDVLWMSVVHGMRGVGGVCDMCMCLARGGVDESCGNRGVLDVCLCYGCSGVGEGALLDI